jgi:hypothetical protein
VALARTPLTALRALDLGDCSIPEAGFLALVRAPWLSQLTALTFWGNFVIGPDAWVVFMSARLRALRVLAVDLSPLYFLQSGEALAGAPWLRNLERLWFKRPLDCITQALSDGAFAGFVVLRSSPVFQALEKEGRVQVDLDDDGDDGDGDGDGDDDADADDA